MRKGLKSTFHIRNLFRKYPFCHRLGAKRGQYKVSLSPCGAHRPVMRAMQEPEREVHARGSGTRGGRKKMLLRGALGRRLKGTRKFEEKREGGPAKGMLHARS